MPTEQGRRSEEAEAGQQRRGLCFQRWFGLAKVNPSIQGKLHKVAGLELVFSQTPLRDACWSSGAWGMQLGRSCGAGGCGRVNFRELGDREKSRGSVITHPVLISTWKVWGS